MKIFLIGIMGNYSLPSTKNDIDFQNKLIDYYHKLESFYKNNPKFFSDKQMQNNHIQEIEQSVIEAQNVIDKNKKIIKAIE